MRLDAADDRTGGHKSDFDSEGERERERKSGKYILSHGCGASLSPMDACVAAS